MLLWRYYPYLVHIPESLSVQQHQGLSCFKRVWNAPHPDAFSFWLYGAAQSKAWYDHKKYNYIITHVVIYSALQLYTVSENITKNFNYEHKQETTSGFTSMKTVGTGSPKLCSWKSEKCLLVFIQSSDD